MNVFDELLMAKQISFEQGGVAILGNRVVMPPVAVLGEYSKNINDSPEQIGMLYGSIKRNFEEMVKTSFVKEYGFGLNDYMKWMTKIALLTGWGNFTWAEVDKQKKWAVIIIDNSPVGVRLAGKVKKPVDHAVRGFIAAAVALMLKSDADCMEEECIALGAKKCKFVIKPIGDFDDTPEFRRQLGMQGKSG